MRDRADHTLDAPLRYSSGEFRASRVFIGSLNLAPRAVVHITEIGVVFESTEIGSGMGEWFDENIGKLAFRLEFKKDKNGTERIIWHGVENGKPILFDTDPYTGFWRRFGVGFMGLLPIESQL